MSATKQKVKLKTKRGVLTFAVEVSSKSGTSYRNVELTDKAVEIQTLLRQMLGGETSVTDRLAISGKLEVKIGKNSKVVGRWWEDDAGLDNEVVIDLPTIGGDPEGSGEIEVTSHNVGDIEWVR